MRDAFFHELLHYFRKNPRIVFLTGDLGYKLFDPLREHDPRRVINCGIREAAMIGYAAGLAKSGLLPFVYTIAPFATLRCLEQIKIDTCYNNNPIVIVGVGGGFAYGPNASTHHGVDDIGTLSCLPGMQIWTPADSFEVRKCVDAAMNLTQTTYLRLGRNKEPEIHESKAACPLIDTPYVMTEGPDGVLITCGFILHEVMLAVKQLHAAGIHPKVIRLTTLRPFPAEHVAELISDGRPVMTIEEHVATGGLGHEVARAVAEAGHGNRFRMLSIPLDFPHVCLSREALLAWAGIDSASIAEAYSQLLKGQGR